MKTLPHIHLVNHCNELYFYEQGMGGIPHGSSSPDIVRGLSETLAGKIATVELWRFNMVEMYDMPLPPLCNLLTEGDRSPDQLRLKRPASAACGWMNIFQNIYAVISSGCFRKETGGPFGMLVHTAGKIETAADRIIQLPVSYL
jgi:hypothetical protein